MDELKRYALMLCAAILMAGIVSMLLPRGNSMKAGKTVLSFFLLSCLILPLNDMKKDLVLEWKKTESAAQHWEDDLQQDVEKLSYSLAEDHILKLIQARLDLLGLKVIKLDVEFIESKEQVLPQIRMDLSKDERVQESELRTILFREYGLEDVEINWQEVK